MAEHESNGEGRRDFIKKAAVAGIAAGAALGSSQESVDAQPANAKAVLPDGKAHTREELLTRLGLDPSTSPEAWIAITSCGSNASALKRPDAERLLKAGKLQGAELGTRLQGLKQQQMAPKR
jgi:hypothetical protein